MCYIVFISHSLHWRYIKAALQEYVITKLINAKSEQLKRTSLLLRGTRVLVTKLRKKILEVQPNSYVLKNTFVSKKVLIALQALELQNS